MLYRGTEKLGWKKTIPIEEKPPLFHFSYCSPILAPLLISLFLETAMGMRTLTPHWSFCKVMKNLLNVNNCSMKVYLNCELKDDLTVLMRH